MKVPPRLNPLTPKNVGMTRWVLLFGFQIDTGQAHQAEHQADRHHQLGHDR